MKQITEKTVTLLGSTGSVGTQAIDVIRNNGYRLRGICAAKNTEVLEQQIREFSPEVCVVLEESAARDLKVRVRDTSTRIECGKAAIEEMAGAPAKETVVNSMMGSAGLRPTLAAIEAGKNIALANKETLVTAGEIVMAKAKEKGVKILPVDSEHSAIFQCLQGNEQNPIAKILLTASGGPFYGFTQEQLEKIGVKETLAHPTWKMGAKITVDSATLMNKGFEVIEAVHLFGVSVSQVQVLVHRQSIVHSMVEYQDGVVMAQMGSPDMRTCIQYALTYPDRVPCPGVAPLDLLQAGDLTFRSPDTQRFPLLRVACDAIEQGGTVPAALNGANEEAVALFLGEKISFTEISALVMETLKSIAPKFHPTLQDLEAADALARKKVRELAGVATT